MVLVSAIVSPRLLEVTLPDTSTPPGFWWQWWVQIAIAVGTLSAVVVALFGPWIRSKFAFVQPKLVLSFPRPLGEATPIQMISPDGSTLSESGRYYHLRVSNARRWSPATDVRVLLLQVEEDGPDGNPQVRWTGDIPLIWRHQLVFPATRVIGHEAFADVISVVKGKWAQIQTQMEPLNLDRTKRGATTFILSLQARAAECDSNILRLKISWDGGWADGEQEMRRHLTIDLLGP